MSTIRAPSPLSDLPQLAEESLDNTVIRAQPPPVVPPLTDFELDLRRRLTLIEQHQVRSDSIVLEVQAEHRSALRALESRIGARLDSIGLVLGRLVAQVSKLVENGHG